MMAIYIGKSVQKACKHDTKFSIEPNGEWQFFSHYLSEEKA